MNRNSIKYILLIFTYILVNVDVLSQNINIRIFADVQLKAFHFSVVQGKYEIIANDRIVAVVDIHDSLYINIENDFFYLYKNGVQIGEYKFAQFRGTMYSNVFMLSPGRPFVKQRVYDDDIYVEIQDGNIKVVNDVDFEKYIAAVIESEGGYVAPMEYYKVQAILCRTYAMKYFGKHINEGYNLCDRVHCQAYNGKSVRNLDVVKATQETSGMVIVDSSLSVISATFFSNSGGETENSEDVWQKKIPYLRAVKDTFSLGQPNASWEKTILLVDWTSYLKSKGLVVNDSDNYIFNCRLNERKKYFKCGDGSVSYKDIRSDLGLKSSFFDIMKSGDTIYLKGKGYGHGVGLAQEGAMSMARKGYSYDKIIKFYYANVLIMSIKNIEFFKVE